MTVIAEPALDADVARRLPPAAIALAAQLAALVLAVVLTRFSPWPGGLASLAIAQGLFAAALGARFGLPVWWLPINAGFVPGALLLRGLDLHPGVYLLGFVALSAVFRGTVRTRVPLFLSSTEACDALLALLPARAGLRVLDLGAGTGTVALRVAAHCPLAEVTGIESAPLPALIARLRVRKLTNCRIERGDFWNRSLAGYDVVYAFLSPAPMERLWRKARAEMKPGSLFVSNSFDVPGVAPHEVLALSGKRSRALLIWRL